jgi:hypothetical protein
VRLGILGEIEEGKTGDPTSSAEALVKWYCENRPVMDEGRMWVGFHYTIIEI